MLPRPPDPSHPGQGQQAAAGEGQQPRQLRRARLWRSAAEPHAGPADGMTALPAASSRSSTSSWPGLSRITIVWTELASSSSFWLACSLPPCTRTTRVPGLTTRNDVAAPKSRPLASTCRPAVTVTWGWRIDSCMILIRALPRGAVIRSRRICSFRCAAGPMAATV
ncbi:MAG: hypothetical protein ABJB47_11810 [Actinomycetota bacterium]